jgi:uncharacterized protein YgiM (DUF1202 family)
MKSLLIVLVILISSSRLSAQLKLGQAKSEINFREGAGVNFRIANTINQSNLLVIMPGESQNGFIEVFDVDTSSHGFVAENLITITDTLFFQTQKFFEYSGENSDGNVEIELINQTSKNLFVWINRNIYSLSAYEKKVLVMDTEEIIFFSSAPGLFPVFGKEVLKKGNTYRWNFTI